MTSSLLTLEDVGEVLRLPTRVVRQLVRRGVFPVVEIPGGHVRVEESSLATFIEECKGAAAKT